MKRAAFSLAIAVLWIATGLSAARITLSHKDPRHSNPDLVDRDWGTHLRNFGNTGQGSEIYVGAGDLSFAGNRKVADMIWNATPSGLNTFTFAYTPSPARFTVTAAGTTTASQFYDFQTPTANPNQVFNALLIQLEAKGNDEVVITNLALTITGGATISLGTIQVAQGQEIFGLIDDIAGAYTSGFTLTGNIVYPAVLHTPKEEDPSIKFFALYDRSQPAQADLTLSKSHTGNFVQGQAGATYTLTARNIGVGATTGTVTVVDNFPPALIPTAASGSGWTCALSTNTGTCTRSDPLSPGASYPPITLTVNVASTAPPEVINGAAITGGNDGNSANNGVTDLTGIVRGPDVAITKTATGSFTQGQVGAGYTLAVANAGGLGTSGVVTVTDSLPAGLAPATVSGTGWSCGISGNTTTCTRSDPLPPGGNYPPISLTVNVASNAPPSVTNQATVGGGGDLNGSNNTASAVTTIARTSDLTITKSHTGNFTQGQQTASYTVTVTNVGAAATNASVLVSDAMGVPLIPGSGSGSGWTCETLSTLIRCQRSDVLAPGASYPPITMTASIAANAPPTVTNVVSVSGGGDGNASNNSASDVATVLPAADLSITKSHAGNFIQGQPGTYVLTISNTGVAATSGSVTVVDQLPGGLTPTTASGTGWACGLAGQAVSCTRNDVLSSGQSYPAITLAVSVQPNAPGSVTNSASVFGGGEANASNNTATDPTTITPGANLTLTKSHTGNFTQGQTGSYTLTVSNVGGAATLNPVIVTDNLPSGLAASAATGAGWSCTAGGQSLTCGRSDVLNAGASYPPITLTVDVAPNAPASLTNTAQVAAGSDVDSSNNTASDPTTVVVVPDLTVTKTHTGSFLQGQVGATYSLTVANVGSGPTISPVTISDSLPAGLTPTAAAGAGWVCNLAGQAVTCSRGDALPGGASYPAITLTVNVAAAAPPTLTNTALVSGGGEVNTSNNTADDVTTIGPGPDLTVTKSHSGDFRQGQIGATFTITVSNPGSPPTTGIVTVTDNVPTGLVPTSAAGAGWVCTISGQDVTCTRSDPLPSGQSYPAIALTVNVQSPGTGSVTNTLAVSGGGDVNPTNNSAHDIVLIVPGADLTITKTHTGNFIQGRTGTYAVTVTNAGVGPTTSTVTVLDPVPLGLTPTAAAGAGWTCTAGSQGVSCQRSDALAAGAGYPPIAITVNVAADAPPTLTNTASVSGGGDGDAANNAASDATTILPGADVTISKSHSGNFTQGQKGAAYTISVENSGGSPTSAEITVVDVLPIGMVPSAATGSGWTCDVDGRAVTCRRSDPLGPGTNYPPITLTVDVAPHAPSSLTNTATVSGGGDVDSADNTAADVTVIASGPDMMVTKTHTGSFFQGQTGATYTIAVTNQGGSPSSGTVRVTDDMSGRFHPTAATGVGWSCTVAGEVVQCERADPLAPGASYPIVTITVDVPTTALPSVTNTADVSGGGDVNAGNNTAADVTTISPGADLAVSKSHTVTPTQGQRGSVPGLDYNLLVSNVGGVPTTDAVTLIDSVPAGLIPVTAAGPGWACSIALQSVTCTRADALGAGASYPVVTLTVDVEADAAASVVNTAIIAGGGDINSANNTVTDPTLINRGQNLTISKSHNASFTQGQRGATYTIAVTNVGAAATLGTVTVIDTVPDGLFPTATSGVGWTCSVSGQTSNCFRGDALGAGASYEPVTVTVDVAADAPASIVNRAIVAGGGDVLSSDNTAEDLTVIAPGPDLTLVKRHANRVGPGQLVMFALTATNGGGAPTEGLVNVVDDMPAGLMPTAASGSGWTCEILNLVVACSRSDALAPGASYPPLMISAGVARDLPIGSSLVNTAEVSRGGDVKLENNTAEDVVLLSPRTTCDVNGDGMDEIVTGAGPGGGPHVNVWTLATGAVTNLASFYAYHPVFGGGAFVGCGDLDGDGLGDVVTGAGAGGGPHVRAFSLAAGYPVEIASFYAYDPAFGGGVRVAAADVDGDGRAEIITGAGPGGGPHVRAFRLVGGTPIEIASFFAYDPAFTGGVFVAAGDVTGDGRAAIITGTYQFGGPVRVFTLGPGGVTERAHFAAYFSAFSGAVRVATADINGDGVAEIITGSGPGGGPHVHAFGVVGGVLTDFASFYAYDPFFCDNGILFPDPVVCDGVYVGGGDVDGDGVAEVITGTNRQGGPLRIFRIGAVVTELTSFYPYFEAFHGPVYVAAVTPGPGRAPLDGSGPPSDATLSMNVDARRMDTDAGLARVVFSSHQVDGRERSPPVSRTFRTAWMPRVRRC